MSQSYPLFPGRLAHGLQVSTFSGVDVVELVSGHENRNARLSRPKASYVLPGATRPVDEARALLHFFHRQGGPLKPFLFDDPFDNCTAAAGAPVTALDVTIGVGDGAKKKFDLVSFAGRPIRFPVLSTLTVAVDGTPLSASGFVFADQQLSLASAPPHGSVVSFGCRYLVLVRFASSEMSITQVSQEAASHEDLRLREVLS
ncbi:MAG: DUF2460 domain-containing protein [Ahrensia sp.]